MNTSLGEDVGMRVVVTDIAPSAVTRNFADEDCDSDNPLKATSGIDPLSVCKYPFYSFPCELLRLGIGHRYIVYSITITH
jgi:hypothetical protein